MKRIVHYSIEEDGRKKVQSISAPLNEDKVELLENTGFIDADYTDPMGIEGKKIELFYNSDTQVIEVEYSNITFDDLTPVEQVKYLKDENQSLRDELSLTQDCLMALDAALLELGGDDSDNEDPDTPENPDENPDSSDPENPGDSGSDETPEDPQPEVPEVFDLVKAIDDAKDGNTITLPEDVDLDSEIYMNKQLTIDLNGHKIESKKDVFASRSGKCDVTIVGKGEIRGGTGGSYTAIKASAGKFTLAGDVKYSVGADENNEGNTCIYVSATGEVDISDGYYSTDAAWSNRYYVLNKKNGSNGVILITGGTFESFDPTNGDDVDAGTFVAEGYVVNKVDNTYVVVKQEEVKNDTEEDNKSEDVESKDETNNENNDTSEVVKDETDVDDSTTENTETTDEETNVGGNE